MEDSSITLRGSTPEEGKLTLVCGGGRWQTCDPVHPYDGVFRFVNETGVVFTTEDCLRILAANGFTEPVFETNGSSYEQRRCWITGPDGERHDGATALAVIFKAERLERLCQDRSDAVLGMLRRKEQ
jgi:hypothetical protein